MFDYHRDCFLIDCLCFSLVKVSPDRYEFDIFDIMSMASDDVVLFEIDENVDRVFTFLDCHLKVVAHKDFTLLMLVPVFLGFVADLSD